MACVALLAACSTTGGLGPAPGAPQAAEARHPAAAAQGGIVRTPLPPRAPAGTADEAHAAATTRDLGELPAPDDPVLDLAREVLEAQAPHWEPLDREGVARVLSRADRERGLPVLLLVALIEKESRFDAEAHGPRGARGLMQVKPFVGRDVASRHGLGWQGVRTLLDPVANVRIGVRYLGELREAFGTAELALAAYNMGPTRLRQRLRHGGSVKGPYVRGLLSRWTDLRRTFGTPTETGIGG